MGRRWNLKFMSTFELEHGATKHDLLLFDDVALTSQLFDHALFHMEGLIVECELRDDSGALLVPRGRTIKRPPRC